MTAKREWLTRAEAAKELGVATKTMDNWAAMTPKRGPRFVVIRGRARYPRKDFDEYVAVHESLAA